ncbi:hypothetical protein DRW48_03495 [Paracoccus suum]|uniref:Flagellin C-terminal domain-containing protein n=1 Tax=Paracoccus suum TaxID=2259340 RepID=A0A344PHM8_9RHOB|nr:flagellin [Paracoccus suum]AXC48883.1 hypothetical protein DRW48_03495 [Paracoccus suum]
MRLTHAGDLARSFGLNQAYAKTKTRLDALTREVASGQKNDVAGSLRGDTRSLASIENSLRRLDAFDRNAAEAEIRLTTGQQALDSMRKLIDGMGGPMVSAPLMEASSAHLVAGAEEKLEAALSLLNTEAAGQFLFAGARSNQPAVATKSALLAQIDAVTAGLSTAAEITQAVSDFFDAPSGSDGYLSNTVTGSITGAGPLPLTTGETMSNNLTAGNPAFRDLLKGLALAVIAKSGPPGEVERGKLIQAAGTVIINADAGLISAQASQGVLEERVELARTRNAAERTTLTIARGSITAADPYEASTALTNAQLQLETLYSITARLSRMSLADRL